MTSLKAWSEANTHTIWDPWLGSEYAARLVSARLHFWYSYLTFCVGLGVFFISLLFARSAPTVSVLGTLLGLAGCVVLALGGRALNKEGRRLADLVRRTGVEVYRRAPLHNIAFFEKWLRRNNLTRGQLLDIISASLNPGTGSDATQ